MGAPRLYQVDGAAGRLEAILKERRFLMSSASLRRSDGDPVANPPATQWPPSNGGRRSLLLGEKMEENRSPREEARDRKRDRRARARHRAGMRTGLLKTMIATIEAQRKRDAERLRKGEK